VNEEPDKKIHKLLSNVIYEGGLLIYIKGYEMKRIFIIMFIVILSVPLMFIGTACNKGTVTTEETTGESVVETTEETTGESVVETSEEITEEAAGIPIPESEVTLDFWFQDWPGGVAWQKAWIPIFEEKYPTIKINLIPLPYNDLVAKLIPSIAQGNEADLLYGWDDVFRGMDRSNLFLQLSPAIYTAEEFASKIIPMAQKHDIGSDGEVYSMSLYSGGRGFGVNVHQDLLDEAGIDFDSLKTWDDIKKAAAKLTIYNNDGSIQRSGFAWTDDVGLVFLDMILMQGAKDKLYNPDTTIWNFNIPEAKKGLEFINSFVEEKIFDPKQGNYQVLFPQKLIAMGCMGVYTMGSFSVDYPDLDLNYITMPVFEGGERVHMQARWCTLMASKHLEGDKKNAALIYLKEVLDNPEFFNIAMEKNYSNSPTSSVAYLDYLDELVKSGKASRNAEISVRTRVVFENIQEIDTAIGLTSGGVTGTITGKIFEVLNGDSTIDEILDYLTTELNKLEEEARL